jgi:hypothetical protein
MSHHFDTPTAQQDPRINVCDFYLFRGRPGTTVMAMTVNPDAGISAPDTFRDEGLYAFRFDLDGDAFEDVTFKIQFGPVGHAEGGEHRHVQTFEVRRAVGHAARKGAEGELIISGRTDELNRTKTGILAFAGLAPDLFAGDAVALGTFRTALFKEGQFNPEAFQNPQNFFAKRNVTVIVIEVPSNLVGRGLVHGWATASLYGHAPEMQVSRWGLPLITNIFMPDLDMRENFNRSGPAEDLTQFGPQIGAVIAALTELAGSSARPTEYANQLIARLCPTVLPYLLDTTAAFDFAGFNGRALTDDAMDVMLTLASNTALRDGVEPDINRTRDMFPYFGPPYTSAEQDGIAPARPVAKKE